MGVYSNTTANAYADKIKAVYEALDQIKKVGDRLTPVEDLTTFQTQIDGLYAQLDLLVEASGIIVQATPIGERILTGTKASIQAELDIGVWPEGLVWQDELDAALAALWQQVLTLVNPLIERIDAVETEVEDWTTFLQNQQTAIEGLTADYTNLATGQAAQQSNIEYALTQLTVQAENMQAIDVAMEAINQDVTNALTGVQAVNDIVSGHTAEIEMLNGVTSIHSSSIDALASELTDLNSGLTANSTAIQEMSTTLVGMGQDMVAQSALTTALKSVIGGSGNLLPNSEYAAGATNWQIIVAQEDWASSLLTVDTFDMPEEVHCLEVLGTPTPDGQIVIESPRVLLEENSYYIVSGYPCVDNGTVELSYKAFNNAGAVLSQGACPPTFNTTTNTNFSEYTRTWIKFLAPTGASYLHLYLTVEGDGDFIAQAALFRPMVEKAWAEQTGPSAWTPNVAGVPEALSTAVQDLNTEVSTINGQITAMSEASTALESRLEQSEAALINEMITSANKNASFAASINNLSGRLLTAEGNIEANSSAVSTLQTDVSNLEGEVSSSSSWLVALQAQVDTLDVDTGGVGSAISELNTRVDQHEDDISVLSDQVVALSSSLTTTNKIFIQPTAPSLTGRIEGDMWVDTDDGNKPYFFTPTPEPAWVVRQDANKTKVYIRNEPPAGANVNDLWIELDNGNKLWRWNGSSWVDAGDTRVSASATAVNQLTTDVSNINGELMAQASSLTTLSTTVGNHTATITQHASSINGLNARWGVNIDVNGYISGITSVNNGTTASFKILADKFEIVAPGKVARPLFTIDGGGNTNTASDIYLGNGRIIIDTGTHMKVQGIGFGVGNEFVEWFGPKMAITACARGNAISYLTKTGDAYFGGSLTAGKLRNAVSSSSLIGVNNEVVCGPFNTLGHNKVVVISYSRTQQREYHPETTANYVAGAGTNTATVQVYRRIGNGVETLWTTFTATGATTIVNDFDGPDTCIQTWSGSVTVTDSDPSVGDRTYRAVITAFGQQTVTRSDGNNDSSNVTQARLTIVSTEE